jgi:peroxiredoxin
VIASDARRAVRGKATYDLARHLDTLSQLLVRLKCEGPEWRDRIEAAVGKANVEALLARDPTAMSEEAETLLGRVCTSFGDVKTPKGTLDELAMEALFAMRHLAVGRKAPEIIGVDIDGAPMKLSDFRGKVVMVSFYGYWCGICIDFFPTERALVEKFAGRPFTLVGVNSDSKEHYRKGLAKIPLNWRSFFDGGSAGGPIAATWQVTIWPTNYIIDHEGIVRFKDLRNLDTLKRAIEGLVATAERASEGPVTR